MSTVSETTSQFEIAGIWVLGGSGFGLIAAPATEAIRGRAGCGAVLHADHDPRDVGLPDRTPGGPADGREQVGARVPSTALVVAWERSEVARQVGRRGQTPTWVGTAWFGPWWLVYRGPLGVTAAHAHHALQAVLGDAVDLLVGAERRSAPAVVLPNVVHRIATAADEATLVYVDGDVARLSPSATLATWSGRPAPSTWAAAAALVEAVCPPGPSTAPESPVVRAARLALADPDDRRSIEDLAAQLGLSSSRLSHLFTTSVGTSMRSYRRWQRLLVAAEAIAGGAGLTEAAHAAGFADGPHLARTFRAHFGLSVTELTSGIRFAIE